MAIAAASGEVPVVVERSEFDWGLLSRSFYQDEVIVFNHSNVAKHVTFEKNEQVQLFPLTGLIQAHSSFRAHLRYTPNEPADETGLHLPNRLGV